MHNQLKATVILVCLFFAFHISTPAMAEWIYHDKGVDPLTDKPVRTIAKSGVPDQHTGHFESWITFNCASLSNSDIQSFELVGTLPSWVDEVKNWYPPFSLHTKPEDTIAASYEFRVSVDGNDGNVVFWRPLELQEMFIPETEIADIRNHAPREIRIAFPPDLDEGFGNASGSVVFSYDVTGFATACEAER